MADDDYVEPLTGEEIIVDACAQLAEHLRRDCNLRDTDSYEGGYSGHVKVSLKLYGMDTMTVEMDVPLLEGKPEGEPDRQFETEFEIPTEPALNMVRERSDQPVPMMTVLETGAQEVKQRRYVRRDRVAAGGATGETV